MIILLLVLYIFWITPILGHVISLLSDFQRSDFSYKKLFKDLDIRNFIFRFVVPIVLFITMLLLIGNITTKWLYVVILIVFSYYVHLSLKTFADILSHNLKFPKSDIKVFILMVLVFAALMYPLLKIFLIFGDMGYYSNVVEQEVSDRGLSDVFAYVDYEKNITLVPFETAMTMIFMKCMLLVDFLITFFIVIIGSVIGIINGTCCEKKPKTSKKKRKVKK